MCHTHGIIWRLHAKHCVKITCQTLCHGHMILCQDHMPSILSRLDVKQIIVSRSRAEHCGKVTWHRVKVTCEALCQGYMQSIMSRSHVNHCVKVTCQALCQGYMPEIIWGFHANHCAKVRCQNNWNEWVLPDQLSPEIRDPPCKIPSLSQSKAFS